MELTPLALDGKVLTIGLQGKPQEVFVLSFFFLRYSKLQTQIIRKVNVYVEWEKKSQEVTESLEIPASVF